MNMLVAGEWRTDAYESTNDDGEFDRQETSFRDRIGGPEFPAEPDRYHLYISRACPWAHGAVLVRKLLGLEDVISMDVLDPYRDTDGWMFTPEKEGCTPDTINGFDYLREAYVDADPEFTGRVTVPVLWDRERETIVNNESIEVMQDLATEFREYADNDVNLYPEGKREEIDRVVEDIYDPINDGVYRAGFADSQSALESAVTDLFDALDHWDAVLEDRRYLLGEELTLADVRLFPTLVRFDPVYHTTPSTLNNVYPEIDTDEDRWKRIVDYENLHAYLRDLYQTDSVAETVNMAHIVEHYSSPGSPPGFGPYELAEIDLRLDEPHDRDKLPTKPIPSLGIA